MVPRASTAPAPSGGRTYPPDVPRTRRRGAALESAILDAAWGEVVTVGFDQVTMAGVAARAGTNKAALYRRWPNRTELLLAAINRRTVNLEPSPVDTGSLRSDVIAILAAMRRRCHAVSVVPDPSGELAAYVRHQAAAEAFEQMQRALSQAADSGEVGEHPVTRLITRLPVDMLFSELALGSQVNARQVADIVDSLFLPLLL
jgi:AcrR family transcriptional regulator